MDENTIAFKYDRRFGAELEVLSYDRRDFQTNRLDRARNELPEGIHHVATLVADATKTGVSVNRYHYTNNNQEWEVKPDRSCGIETCSPVLKGFLGVEQVCKVVDAFAKNSAVGTDERCGMHVHIEVADCSLEVLSKIIGYWLKCETVFLDAMPESRKRNCYCQQLGVQGLFEHDVIYSPEMIVKKIGNRGPTPCKYYTMNTYHFMRDGRRTIEFRIADHKACVDPFYVKNWIRLLIHFVEMARKAAPIQPYVQGNSWSSYLWLDPMDVFRFLGFFGKISPGMTEIRNWFLARLARFTICNEQVGVWGPAARQFAIQQVKEIADIFGLTDELLAQSLNPLDTEKALYDRNTRI